MLSRAVCMEEPSLRHAVWASAGPAEPQAAPAAVLLLSRKESGLRAGEPGVGPGQQTT